VAVAGASGLAAVGLVVLAVRRRRSPVPVETGPVPAPVPVPALSPPLDLRPLAGLLASPAGRRYATTTGGQLAVLAGMAFAAGDSVAGDLARAGSLRALSAPLPAQPALATFSTRLTPQLEGVGR
jgi:hypothetical protein